MAIYTILVALCLLPLPCVSVTVFHCLTSPLSVSLLTQQPERCRPPPPSRVEVLGYNPLSPHLNPDKCVVISQLSRIFCKTDTSLQTLVLRRISKARPLEKWGLPFSVDNKYLCQVFLEKFWATPTINCQPRFKNIFWFSGRGWSRSSGFKLMIYTNSYSLAFRLQRG